MGINGTGGTSGGSSASTTVNGRLPEGARPDARLRRARCLVCYWRGDILYAHLYPGSEPFALPPHTAGVLTAFTDWSTPEQVSLAFPRREPRDVLDNIATLAKGGVLLAEGSGEAARDEERAGHWEPWSPQAAFLHYTSEESGPPPEPAVPAPELFTSYPGADRLLLPRHPVDLSPAYGAVLYRRRTHSAFAGAPVPLATLAALLATVFGPVDYVDARRGGARYRRTSPNAGSCRELDAYLAVRDVAGVTPGWYHYNAAEHSLELLGDGCTGEELTELCAGQRWVGEAAFLVALVAVVDRRLTQHTTPRAYRVCLLNAGHLGQTFALTATALGLAPFQLASYRDTALMARLTLDDATHAPLHLLGAGSLRPG
ncbi:SagB/ThcOx family dehydrogenase [Streptomyces sp. SBT349]|uniref:SagB/ThcOx family dehydrogenase n=1 Tax=Streptomyces sp. SBT349 TaxID=1580539 RepID=UPI00069F3E96|nr:SagB/ThcOx family dehydrogenase [Streptomyces sp. SBT349]